MTPSILMLYTGGTIGMAPSDQGYRSQSGFEDRLRPLLTERHTNTLPNFTIQELAPAIDSSNITPTDWSRMAQTLMDAWGRYSGFVILHGTDTMAYTASALSFLLRGVDKPVVITGSQIPLVAPDSDGLGNILNALRGAAAERTEVMISFAGRFVRGNRARKVHSTDFTAFDSPNFDPLSPLIPHLPQRDRQFAAPNFLNGSTLFLPFYPGQSTAQVVKSLQDPTVQGVVLESYGLGNPPDTNETLMGALNEAAARGVTIVNITQCFQGRVDQATYATGDRLAKMGVISGYDMTREAAIAKLNVMIALGLSPEDRRRALHEDWAGEITMPPKTENN